MLRMTLRWRILVAMAKLIVHGQAWRVDVRGLEHVPTDGGAVLAFNHHSYLDFVMVAWAIHIQLHRPVRFLAKREIWQSGIAGWIVRFADAVPVDRGSRTGRASAFAAATVALRNGDLVGVAPEQTISPSHELLPFRTGAARMAQLGGVPIIPVIGWGTQRAVPWRGSIRPRFRLPVTVDYGPALHVGPDDHVVTATAELQERMEAMLRDVQDRYPDRPRPGQDASWLPARLGGTAPSHAEVLARHREREHTWDEDPGDEHPGDAPAA